MRHHAARCCMPISTGWVIRARGTNWACSAIPRRSGSSNGPSATPSWSRLRRWWCNWPSRPAGRVGRPQSRAGRRCARALPVLWRRSVGAALVVFAFLVGAALDRAIAVGNLVFPGRLLDIGARLGQRLFVRVDIDPLGLLAAFEDRLLLLAGARALGGFLGAARLGIALLNHFRAPLLDEVQRRSAPAVAPL